MLPKPAGPPTYEIAGRAPSSAGDRPTRRTEIFLKERKVARRHGPRIRARRSRARQTTRSPGTDLPGRIAILRHHRCIWAWGADPAWSIDSRAGFGVNPAIGTRMNCALRSVTGKTDVAAGPEDFSSDNIVRPAHHDASEVRPGMRGRVVSAIAPATLQACGVLDWPSATGSCATPTR